MTEANGTTSTDPGTSSRSGDCLCGSIGKAFRMAADAFGPPEAARQHFRDARKEVLLGIRDIIDARIEHLSRQSKKGARIVVE